MMMYTSFEFLIYYTYNNNLIKYGNISTYVKTFKEIDQLIILYCSVKIALLILNLLHLTCNFTMAQ